MTPDDDDDTDNLRILRPEQMANLQKRGPGRPPKQKLHPRQEEVRPHREDIRPAPAVTPPVQATPAENEDDMFFGLSKGSCLAVCVEQAATGEHQCWITGVNNCANPLANGLQSRFQNDPRALSRYNRVKKWLRLQQAKAS